MSGKEKHININKFAGLSRTGWVPKFCLCGLFGSFPMWEKKHISSVPPKSRHYFVCVFFSLCVFFRSQKFRERPRGVENSGGWKTYRKFGEKNPPQKRFWTPHLRYVSPPPLFLATLCHFPQKKEAPTRPTPISEASKSGFGEHTLQYVSPPQIHVIRFAPPSAAAQKVGL